MGIEEHTEACPECDGSGEVDCMDCEGSGIGEDGEVCDACFGDGSEDCPNCSQ